MLYLEQQILELSVEDRADMAFACLAKMLVGDDDEPRVSDLAANVVTLVAARMGVNGDRAFNAQEREICRAITKSYNDKSVEDLEDDILSWNIDDEILEGIRMYAMLGQDVAMALVYYILCWALADEEIEPDVEDRIERLFGVNLLVDFTQSGMESVPVPRLKVSLTKLEYDIISWFQCENEPHPLKDIQKKFSSNSAAVVKNAMEHLRDLGLVFGGENFIMDIYFLDVDNLNNADITVEGQGKKHLQANSETEEGDLERKMQSFFDELAALENELGYTAAAKIEGTDFDYYRWTFTQGKIYNGGKWKIAIPDGFVTRGSGQNLQILHAAEETGAMPITISFGKETPGSDGAKAAHIQTRAALAELAACLTIEMMRRQGVTCREFDIQSVATDDNWGSIITMDMGMRSNKITCTIYTAESLVIFYVDTGYMNDAELAVLKQSLLAWIKTIRCTNANARLTNPPFADNSTIVQIGEGRVTLLEEAVKKANDECTLTFSKRWETLSFLKKNDISPKDLRDRMEDILQSTMEVRTYYIEQADALVEKLKIQKLPDETMAKVYACLKKLDNIRTSATLDDVTASIQKQYQIADILKKWKKDSTAIENRLKLAKEKKEKEQQEQARKQQNLLNYQKARGILENPKKTSEDVLRAQRILKELGRYSDAPSLLEKCQPLIKQLQQQEAERKKESDYQSACAILRHPSKTKESLLQAQKLLKSVGDYADADALLKDAQTQFDRLQQAEEKKRQEEQERKTREYEALVQEMKRAETKAEFRKLADRFDGFGAFGTAQEQARKCRQMMNKIDAYEAAVQLAEQNTIESLNKAIAKFQEAGKCRDAEDKIMLCRAQIEDIQEKQRLEAIARAKRRKKVSIIAASITILAAVCVLLAVFWGIPTIRYNSAISLMKDGRYSEAKAILTELDGFGSSQGKIAVIDAMDEINEGNFDSAIKSILAANESVSVEYNANGGVTNPSGLITYTTLSDYSALLTPTKEGYRFAQWELSTCGLDESNSLKIVLRAVWIDGYFISYDLAGGSAENPMEYHKDGDSVHIENPVRTGYTFLGWTGTDLAEPTVDLVIPTGSYGDRAYTANWKANRYTLALDANGGAVDQTAVSAEYDNAYALPTPTRDYYTFAGWFDIATGKEYAGGQWEETKNVALVAQWIPVTYTITYDLSGGTNSAQNPGAYHVESTSISLSAPSRTGYKFVGWYTDRSCSQKISEITTGTHGDMTLYAKWEAVQYTITYELNGGSMAETEKTVFTIEDLPISLPSASKSDYNFENWIDASTSKVITQLTALKDYTLSATYTPVGMEFSISRDGSYYSVTGYSGTAITVSIPAHYKGLPVKAISNSAFASCSQLVAITIPDTITTIGEYAFKGCISLKSITVPNSVTAIGAAAFSGCSALESMTLPFVGRSASATLASSSTLFGYIFGTTSYEGSAATKQYTAANAYSYYTYYIPTGLTTVTITGGNILHGAFYNCENLITVIIESKCTSIDRAAFCGCYALTDITMPGSVASIGEKAFYRCYGLANITISGKVTSIKDKAFYECVNLTNIVFKGTKTQWNAIKKGSLWDYGVGDYTITYSPEESGDQDDYVTFGRITLSNSGYYVTDIAHLHTNSAGVQKYELKLSYYKSDALIFNIEANSDGSYSLVTDDGRYLLADGTNVKLVTAATDDTKFVFEAGDNGLMIRCATATYEGNAQYLETYMGYLTCYGLQSNSDTDNFLFLTEPA